MHAALAETPLDTVRRGHELLVRGRYAEGFRLFDAWRDLHPDIGAKWPLPSWSGEPLAGRRFLIAGEQGFGDQIMFARFARLLQAEGADVVWFCKPPLERLFRQCLGIRTVGPGDELDGVSFYCPSSRLPNLFFPPLDRPPSAPYLAAPPVVQSGAQVGLVTRGNPAYVNDAARSLPSDMAEELAALPGCISLLPEDTGAVDFYDTAGLIADLELVVTVDTSVAHLAGAMGKPVWIMLPALGTDWRWMRDREDSPWYPSARLFRQASPGDWRGVVERVKAELSRR